MKNWLRWISNGVICIGLFSCQESFDTGPARTDAEIAPYLSRFGEEAAKRGIDVTLKLMELDVEFGAVDNDEVYGQCTRSTKKRKRILINQAQWQKDGDLAHERIIFHELGHCLLDLPHLNQSFSNGTCQSIMNGTENGFGCDQNYSYRTRTYYLDVLFGRSPDPPAWAFFPFLNDFFTTTVQGQVLNELGSTLSGVKCRLINQQDSSSQVALSTVSSGLTSSQFSSNLTGTFDGKTIPDGTYLVEFSKKGFVPVQQKIEYTGQGLLLLDEVRMLFTDRCLATLQAEFRAEGTEVGISTNPARVVVNVSLLNGCDQPVGGLKYKAYYAQGGEFIPVQEGALPETGEALAPAVRQEASLVISNAGHSALRPGRAMLFLVIKRNEVDELFVFRYTIRLVA